MSEYDLKKSEKGIGQLYPILEAKDGEVIDGFHREEADKGWKRVRLEHIDTEEKKLIARLVANFHRRQITREEKIEWINGLASIYKNQGLKVGDFGFQNEVRNKIVEVTGLHPTTVNEYLSEEFKQIPKGGSQKPRVPASQRIEHKLGKDVAERFRKQVLEEQKLSPIEKAELEQKRQREREERKRRREEKRKKREEQIRKQVEEEAKRKLLQDKEFIEEAAKLASETEKPESPKADLPSDSSPQKSEQIIKEMVKEIVPAIKSAFANIPPENPHDPERNKLVLNMLLKNLQQGLVFCPVCGKRMLECSHCHSSLEQMKEEQKL